MNKRRRYMAHRRRKIRRLRLEGWRAHLALWQMGLQP
jgi:hypothetical protein